MLNAPMCLIPLLLTFSCAVQAPNLESILAGGVPTTRSDLRAMAEHNHALLEKVLPATVAVGSASGVIVPGGFVLTAGHVVREPGRKMSITLCDGTVLRGESLGLDHRSDSGLIRVLTPGDLPTVEMGRSSELELGEWCMMLGHPGGPRPGRTLPVRFGRVLAVPDKGYLVTDCTMSAGDSGGPLFDMQGRVIGINSRITRNLATNMHVPIDAYHDHWQALVDGDELGEPSRRGRSRRSPRPRRPRIELGFDSENTAAGESGIRIIAVEEGSLADLGGLKKGDVMLEIAERDVMSPMSPRRLFARQESEAAVAVLVMRGAKEVELTFTMPKLPPRERRSTANAGSRSQGDARRRSGYSKSNKNVVTVFRPVVASARQSIAVVRADGDVTGFGAVVSASGQILTQATDLDGVIECVLSDGETYTAQIVATDEPNNLVLLAIDASGLRPVDWANAVPAVGAWVATVGSESTPVAIGVVSTEVHTPGKAYLGISSDRESERARIASVTEGLAADAAGIEGGDIVLAVDDKEVDSWAELVAELRRHKPGDEIEMRLKRGTGEITVRPRLGSRAVERSSQANLWGPLSAVRGGFRAVLQHDSVLRPEQCGGPLVDLDGKVVGINIARVGRVETVAIPVPLIAEIVAALQASAAK